MSRVYALFEIVSQASESKPSLQASESKPDAGAGTAILDRPVDPQIDDRPWVCIVWDDPVNLMSYVAHVFITYFHFSRQKANDLMLEVHKRGKAIVSSGSREEMERDCNALHGFGLWATVDRAE